MIEENGETIEGTNDGEVVIHLVSTDNSSSRQHVKRNSAAFLDMLNRHTNIVSGQITQEHVDATSIVREGRREL